MRKPIKNWDANQGIPSDDLVEIFVKDMASAKKNREVGKTIGNLATRVNYEIPGLKKPIYENGPTSGQDYRGAPILRPW